MYNIMCVYESISTISPDKSLWSQTVGVAEATRTEQQYYGS